MTGQVKGKGGGHLSAFLYMLQRSLLAGLRAAGYQPGTGKPVVTTTLRSCGGKMEGCTLGMVMETLAPAPNCAKLLQLALLAEFSVPDAREGLRSGHWQVGRVLPLPHTLLAPGSTVG